MIRAHMFFTLAHERVESHHIEPDEQYILVAYRQLLSPLQMTHAWPSINDAYRPLLPPTIKVASVASIDAPIHDS